VYYRNYPLHRKLNNAKSGTWQQSVDEKENVMPTKTDPGNRAAPGPPERPARSRARALGWSVGAVVAGAAAITLVATQIMPSTPFASTFPTKNCAPVPSKCGFPDASTAGPPAGMTLKTVPGQVSSGPGWKYSSAYQEVEVTGNGANLTGLYIPHSMNITASNVTINDVKIVTSGLFGVSLRHTRGVTISNSVISGQNATTGRVSNALTDIYGDSTGMVIKNNNISYYRTAVAVTTGLISGNYIHNPGYVTGDHTNGIFVNGSTQPLTISHNTIFNNLGQTDAISLDTTAGGQVANKSVTGNLLAGGSYTIYGGASLGNTTRNMIIANNVFGQAYFAKSGQYGPVAYFDSADTGNIWTGNTWDTTGAAVPSP
jgi:hypothetical protein